MKRNIVSVIAGAFLLLSLGTPLALAEPKGETVKVKGEEIDLWCFLEGGDHGADHKDCAVACAKAGNPIEGKAAFNDMAVRDVLLTNEGLVVTMERRFTGSMPLSEAHTLMAGLERELRTVVPNLVRVHINPEISALHRVR